MRPPRGWVYDRRKFLIFLEKYVFGTVESQYMIKFTKYTTIAWWEGLEAEFPFCIYALTQINQLPRPTNMPERFKEVVGIISGVPDTIQYSHASRPEPSTKRTIHLESQTADQVATQVNLETKMVTELVDLDMFDDRDV